MDEKKTPIGVIDFKYGDFGDFSAEIEALEKFEVIKRNSSNNLRSSQSRMVAGFIVVLCLTLALGIFTFAISRISTRDIKDVYDGPLSVRYYALNLNVNAHKAYLSMRNLALCEDGETQKINFYVTQARESIILVNEGFSTLKSLTDNNEELDPKFVELELLLSQWHEIREANIKSALNGNMAACRLGVSGPGTLMVDKINNCISEITSDATKIAQLNQDIILKRTRVFDVYSVLLTMVILTVGIIVMVSVIKHTGRAVKLVDESQQEQNKILDELMIMDETLRQTLSKLEHETEVISEMQERYANSLEAVNDAIWELNLETSEFFASEKWEDITGLPAMHIVDKESILRLVHEDDRKIFTKAFERNSGYFNLQVRAKSPDSSPRWLNIRGKWLDDHRLTGSVSDITKKKQSEQYIEYMAYHDSITQLPNRAMFVKALEDAIKKSEKCGIGGGVLFIDLDNFKTINDGYGHDLGDRLLFEVARRLQQYISEDVMLARFGGDEFLILIENVIDNDIPQSYINAVTDAFSTPFSLDDGVFYVTASIGISLFPEDGNDVTQILKNSDAAMYESKSAGRNTFAFYNKIMSAKLLRKSAIGDILRGAIENGSVYMVYQPQVRCYDNKAVSCEALMRLKDQGLGFIPPNEFIPVAEETRLIVPLGYWAIRNVIETDLELLKKGVEMNSISVNVSEIQLREHDFAEQVQKIVEEYDYDASRLHFEITESILLSNLEEEIVVLNKIRSIGIKIELDDFGTGYSSLNYIRAIPLDVIKIDKCFTDEIGISSEKEGLIDLIVRLAKTFDADVVAEGVETAEQVDFFKDKGNIILQGYYYSKPLEINDLPAKFDELNGSIIIRT